MQLRYIDLINELETISLKQEKYKNPNVINTPLKFYGIYTKTLVELAKKYKDYELISFKFNEIYEVNFIYIYLNLYKYQNDISKQTNFILENSSLFNSWSLVDNMASLLKEATLETASTFINSNLEFIRRFGYVILLKKLSNDLMINEAFKVIINDSRYYVLMAEAWLISECLIKSFDYSFNLLKEANFSLILKKKSIQKALDSYRVSKENKILLKNYRDLLKGENNVK